MVQSLCAHGIRVKLVSGDARPARVMRPNLSRTFFYNNVVDITLALNGVSATIIAANAKLLSSTPVVANSTSLTRQEGRQVSPMTTPSPSMQLTRAADYAIRAMIHMASLPEDRRTLLTALATATGSPVSFLSKVLQALSRADLISSKRGQLGGFALLPRGRNASVREVVEAIDGPISLNRCLLHGTGCGRQSHCPAHQVWVDAQIAMLNVLDAAKIADLGAGSTRSAFLHPVSSVHFPPEA
jgi:Rrf2 family protein